MGLPLSIVLSNNLLLHRVLLRIQPELIYSSKGAKLTYDNLLLGKGEYRFNLNYVEVPVLAVINIAKNINLNGGGYVSYLASANVKDMDNNGNITNAKDLNADNFNRFDYGLIGGVGIDVQNITIGGRYTYGLKEVGTSGSLSGKLLRTLKTASYPYTLVSDCKNRYDFTLKPPELPGALFIG